MFFSFLALMVRAFIWCWLRLTWKIMSTWCRFSMLGQQDRTHSSICCTDRFRKLELFERYKTSVRTPRKLRSHVQSTCQARSLSINFCSFLQLEVIESENYWNPHECDFFHNLSHFKKYFVNFIWQRGEKAWETFYEKEQKY